MEKQEYLNEEKYQQTNAKVKKVGKILLIIGGITLVLGFILLVLGFVGFGNTAQDGFNSIGNEIINSSGSLNQDTVNNIFNNALNQTQNTANSAMGSMGLFTIGSFMLTIGFGLLIAGGMAMLLAHKREITAYATQQSMPIQQEKIEKMAPTIGSAAGTIGKELAKGIKEGINEADSNKE